MNPPIVSVSHLSKVFAFPVKNPSHGKFRNLFYPDTKKVRAVDDVSFSVPAGERVAFIGPNGAGKSTTIKMLTGILYPTDGEVRVLGMNPAGQRKKLAYRIGTVFGQRSQLLPNLPLADSFAFFGVMYDMSHNRIRERTRELSSLFHLHDFIDQPVRKLSLGQRMRGEIAASLMHSPDIIFLDEPTIGLDVVAKKSLRDLLLTLNREEKTTLFLTSHDVGDIESLCERTIIINHGKVIQDGDTLTLARSLARNKNIDLIPECSFTSFPDLPEGIHYLSKNAEKITVSVDIDRVGVQEALRQLLGIFRVDDVDVYNVELETIIRTIYENAPSGK